ncbi:MerR family transcriptional regulator [Paenibacillus sp. 1011MAR3C5]|uniref:MerR family transcriptional regulator n=1 Tax=Paenibacillus sp. 1011MAR3C5 TaxID=1675787 RepID=UPI000E6B5CC6|nr:MerR family transcriptional regulator [Paenibacillus sp. 1011MAR3C5]RJE84286.1 MerR family transcriptional regulator [Paenibacillus sp. 1011MAR3C5]
MYSIGQLSQRTGISIRTLRYYDELGLLKPAKVAESGNRYYSNEEIRLLQHITALKELGFTLASIKELLSQGKDSADQEQRWMSYLDVELEAIERERARLDHMAKLLQTAKHALVIKGEFDPEDIFLFIRAIQSPSEIRDRFLAQHFTEREIAIIKNLPDLSSKDPRAMKWAQLIRTVKLHMDEPPSSVATQQLAAEIVELTMEWFEQDEILLQKYWTLIRPEEGMDSKVYALDAGVMDHIDHIVDWYLLHGEGAASNDGKDQ